MGLLSFSYDLGKLPRYLGMRVVAVSSTWVGFSHASIARRSVYYFFCLNSTRTVWITWYDTLLPATAPLPLTKSRTSRVICVDLVQSLMPAASRSCGRGFISRAVARAPSEHDGSTQKPVLQRGLIGTYHAIQITRGNLYRCLYPKPSRRVASAFEACYREGVQIRLRTDSSQISAPKCAVLRCWGKC